MTLRPGWPLAMLLESSGRRDTCQPHPHLLAEQLPFWIPRDFQTWFSGYLGDLLDEAASGVARSKVDESFDFASLSIGGRGNRPKPI